jgi:hypothetical protein
LECERTKIKERNTDQKSLGQIETTGCRTWGGVDIRRCSPDADAQGTDRRAAQSGQEKKKKQDMQAKARGQQNLLMLDELSRLGHPSRSGRHAHILGVVAEMEMIWGTE